MLEAAKKGIIRGAAPKFFSRPCRVQNPTLTTALLSQRSGGLLIPYTQPLCPALSLCRRGRRGEHTLLPPLPFSTLMKSSHTEERYKTSIVSIQVSLHCQHIFLFLHTCAEPREHCAITEWATAPPSTYTAFYTTFQLKNTTSKTNSQHIWKGKKLENSTVFCVPSDTILTEEVFRTFYPL